MNASCEKNNAFNSNTRIYEGYFTDALVGQNSRSHRVDVWLSALLSLLHILSSPTVRRLCKTVLVALCLVGFVGIVGAVEQGTLGMGAGFLLGGALVAIEYLCLRGRTRG